MLALQTTPSSLHHYLSALSRLLPRGDMPRLNENTERQLRDLENGARAHTLKAWDSFSNFALRDNVLEVAVGLMWVSKIIQMLDTTHSL